MVKGKEIVLDVKEYDLNNLDKAARVLIFAPPKTGKTKLIEHICWFKRSEYPTAVVISETVEDQGSFDFIPPLFRHTDSEKVTTLMGEFRVRQKELTIHNPAGVPTIYIYDDAVDRKILDSKVSKPIFKYGRHWGCLHLFACHFAMELPPIVRAAYTVAFIGKTNDPGSLEAIHKNFVRSFIPKLDDFIDILNQITEDHTFLVIVNDESSSKIEDRLFWFKAELHDSFKFGCREYHEWNALRLAKDYRKGESGL